MILEYITVTNNKVNPAFPPDDSLTAPTKPVFHGFQILGSLDLAACSYAFFPERVRVWRVTLSGDLWGWSEKGGDWMLCWYDTIVW